MIDDGEADDEDEALGVALIETLAVGVILIEIDGDELELALDELEDDSVGESEAMFVALGEDEGDSVGADDCKAPGESYCAGKIDIDGVGLG